MELAADYIILRALDEQKRFDDDTVKAYAESLKVTQNKYNAGVSALSDVDAAATLLHNVQRRRHRARPAARPDASTPSQCWPACRPPTSPSRRARGP